MREKLYLLSCFGFQNLGFKYGSFTHRSQNSLVLFTGLQNYIRFCSNAISVVWFYCNERLRRSYGVSEVVKGAGRKRMKVGWRTVLRLGRLCVGGISGRSGQNGLCFEPGKHGSTSVDAHTFQCFGFFVSHKEGQAMKECWYEETLFKRASKYGPWLRAEIKGDKKFGRFLSNEQLKSGPNYSNGEGSKANDKVKEDEPKSVSPQGISPAIIPVSKGDKKSTMEKSDTFNASDSHILAGKNIVDDSSPLVTSLEEEKTFQSDICIQNKIVIDSFPSLSIEVEVQNEKDEPYSSGYGNEDNDPVEADDLAEAHPHEE
ncbi:hypothetical protein V6N11_020382 [Hibiscus sabdariffa]|uniref:Uncharacterized protein n=1 Tax=Hibiscus sabdariffa TaxID=183260 RepID=A0ABR2Q8Q9_9ROSI